MWGISDRRSLSRAAAIVMPLAAGAYGLSRLTPRLPAADLRVADAVSIATLDPAQISWLQDIRLAIQLYEGLCVDDPSGGGVMAGCADPVTGASQANESATTYRFRIRDQARWSNGDPVEADDFVFAWRRALEPGTARDYAYFFEKIVGVADYLAWRKAEISRLAEVPPEDRATAAARHWSEADERFRRDVRIVAEDARMLRIELTRPVAYFRELLTGPVFLPLHRHTVRDYERRDASGLLFYDSRWCKPGRTHYNGAYLLADWRFKRGLRLNKNPHYHGAAGVQIGSIDWIEVADANTAWIMYETGSIDWLLSLEAGFTPELVGREGPSLRHDVRAFPAFGTYFYNINCAPRMPDGSPNPLADRRVRQAITMAIDRAAICAEITRRGEPPATTLIPPGTIADYPGVDGLAFDAEAASRLLAEAGFPRGRGLPEISLLYNNEAGHGLIAQAVAAMLKAHLGMRVRLIGKEAQSYREDKQRHNFMIARASWYGDYDDPTSFLDIFRADSGNNDSAYADPEFDRMLNAADLTQGHLERLAALADCERYLVRDALPLIPLFHYTNVYAYNPRRLTGVSLSPRLLPLMRQVALLERGP